MAFVVERAILKGRLAGVVATRSMFTAEIQYASPETRFAVWSSYIGTILGDIATFTGSVWTIETVEIQYRDVSGQWITVEDTPLNYVFTNSGEPLANVISAVLVGRALGVRKMGRKFFPGLVEGSVTGNSLTTAAMVGFAAAAAHYIAPHTSAGGSVLQPGIVDKTGTFHRFISGFVSSLLGTTRRRKPGLGI